MAAWLEAIAISNHSYEVFNINGSTLLAAPWAMPRGAVVARLPVDSGAAVAEAFGWFPAGDLRNVAQRPGNRVECGGKGGGGKGWLAKEVRPGQWRLFNIMVLYK